MTRKIRRRCRVCGRPEKLYAFGYSSLTPYSQVCADCLNKILEKSEEEKTMTDTKLTREEAMSLFRTLVARYGLYWTARVPQRAYDEMNRINGVLDEGDRREALGWRR